MQRTRVKICGITRLADALAAVALGADALGFVFYEKSPRYIAPEKVKEIVRRVHPFVGLVGLFVNPTAEYANHVMQSCGLDVIQLHGDESPAFCAQFDRRVMKAIPVETQDDLQHIKAFDCPVLLDAKAPEGVYGGTGKHFDWRLLDGLIHTYPLILAGGLNPGNIGEALSVSKLYGVDVSSGVESAPGLKDRALMQAFMESVRHG